MCLFIRISRIATRQPTWKLVVIGLVLALLVATAVIEASGLRPDWMLAHRVQVPQL